MVVQTGPKSLGIIEDLLVDSINIVIFAAENCVIQEAEIRMVWDWNVGVN